MPSKFDTPGTTLGLLTQLVNGLGTKPPGGATTMVVDAQSTAMADVVTELKGYEGTYQAEADAKAALAAARQARIKLQPKALPRLRLITEAVKGMMGPNNPALTNLGIEPEKVPAPLTAEKQVLKAERNAATRKARGTLGAKQKKAIKGQVPAPAPAAPTATSTKTGS